MDPPFIVALRFMLFWGELADFVLFHSVTLILFLVSTCIEMFHCVLLCTSKFNQKEVHSYCWYTMKLYETLWNKKKHNKAYVTL